MMLSPSLVALLHVVHITTEGDMIAYHRTRSLDTDTHHAPPPTETQAPPSSDDASITQSQDLK